MIQNDDYNVVMKRIQIVSTQKSSFLCFVSPDRTDEAQK